MFRNIKCLLIFCIVFVLGIIDVSALDNVNTNTYFNNITKKKVLVVDSNKAKINTVIPNEYSFVLGGNYSDTLPSGVKQLSYDELSQLGLDKSFLGYTSKAVDIEKGKFSNTYVNVGTYNGKKIDVKLIIMDFETYNGPFDSYNTYQNNEIPYITFLNENFDNSSNIKPLGFFANSMSWVKVKYEFFESGTNTPIKVKGHTAYWEINNWQGIHFFDNNTGLYTSANSKLYYSTIDSKDFVYYVDWDASFDSYDPHRSIAETFEGDSMTRIYSFVYPMVHDINTTGGAYGQVLHSSVVPYGRKSYASDTPSGADGSEVKIGDKIKYQVQVVNDYMETQTPYDPIDNKDKIDYSVIQLDNESDNFKLSISDNLSKGLTYVKGSSKLVIDSYNQKTSNKSIEDPKISATDNGTVLEWNDIIIGKMQAAILTYEVEVTSDASSEVINNASAVIAYNCTESSSDPDIMANTVKIANLTSYKCADEKKIVLNKLTNPLFKEKEQQITKK